MVCIKKGSTEKAIPEVLLKIVDASRDEVNSAEDELMMKPIILSKCAEKLALYKVPQHIVFKNSFALSATGKKIKK